jgi:hypothetical protein
VCLLQGRVLPACLEAQQEALLLQAAHPALLLLPLLSLLPLHQRLSLCLTLVLRLHLLLLQ